MKPGPLTAAQVGLQPRGYRRRGAGREWGVAAQAETRLASATAQARRPLPPRGPAPYRAGYLARTPLRDPRSSDEKTAGAAGSDCSGGDVATRGAGRCALIPGKQAVSAASVPEDRTSSSAGQRRPSSRVCSDRRAGIEPTHEYPEAAFRKRASGSFSGRNSTSGLEGRTPTGSWRIGLPAEVTRGD